MERLIALPIKGESFLLRRGGKVVLVDGGYNSQDLSAALKSHAANVQRIDIVVCTHSDRDHAGGLANLIGASGLHIGEFWLPSIWAESLPELIYAPGSVVKALVSELDNLPENLKKSDGSSSTITKLLNSIAIEERRSKSLKRERIREAPRDETEDRGNGRLNHREHVWRVRLQRNEQRYAAAVFKVGKRQIQARQYEGKVSPAVTHYWLSLFESAEVTRAIMLQAILFNVPIRWFDYRAFESSRVAKGGNPGFLEPLNSVEVQPTPPQLVSFLARLSPVNEECLVFLSPPQEEQGLGVVFCADSPLGDGPRYSNSFFAQHFSASDYSVVATAPHHGSEHNQPAYGHLNSWASVALWARTGGSVRQPGNTFKALSSSQRVCSHCPQTCLALREVNIGIDQRAPYFVGQRRPCDC